MVTRSGDVSNTTDSDINADWVTATINESVAWQRLESDPHSPVSSPGQ